jgi:hypothetical protein
MDEQTLNLDDYEPVIEYFDQSVLAPYLHQPDRYAIETDYFEGHVSSSYAAGAPPSDPIDVRFGYRTLASGDLAIAAFRPDLHTKSSAHVERWAPFTVRNPAWVSPDPRYESWVRRYLAGQWGLDNGPRLRLQAVLKTINALTTEVVGVNLFEHDGTESLAYPLAENTHRYQDAHQRLYGLLVDGLRKDCNAKIGAYAGVVLKRDSDKTVSALKKLPSGPGPTSPLWNAFDTTSRERWLAGHKVRPPAARFGAFERFNEDLERWVSGLRDLLTSLEKLLDMTGETAEARQTAKVGLPRLGGPPPPNYSINEIRQIVGKTVTKVEFGHGEPRVGIHRTEAMVLHFSDGTCLGIRTGSNVGNFASEYEGLAPDDFHVDFILQWVPAVAPRLKPEE